MDGATITYAVGSASLACAAAWRAVPKYRRHRTIVVALRIAAGIAALTCIAESQAWLVVGGAAVVGAAVGVVLPRRKNQNQRASEDRSDWTVCEPRQRDWREKP